jgi:hypothetical protein
MHALEELAGLQLAEQVLEHLQAPERVELEAQARKKGLFAALDGELEEPRLIHFQARVVDRKVRQHQARLSVRCCSMIG